MQKYLDQKASKRSEMEPFMAEVSDWKLLTIDLKGFILDVMWSLDSPGKWEETKLYFSV